jgi:hypothetical protein
VFGLAAGVLSSYSMFKKEAGTMKEVSQKGRKKIEMVILEARVAINRSAQC